MVPQKRGSRRNSFKKWFPKKEWAEEGKNSFKKELRLGLLKKARGVEGGISFKRDFLKRDGAKKESLSKGIPRKGAEQRSDFFRKGFLKMSEHADGISKKKKA